MLWFAAVTFTAIALVVLALIQPMADVADRSLTARFAIGDRTTGNATQHTAGADHRTPNVHDVFASLVDLREEKFRAVAAPVRFRDALTERIEAGKTLHLHE